MVKKVAAFAAEYQMLEKEDRIIVGVSGGADSVCLLLMLLELQKEIGFDLVAVHVNHGLRGDTALRDERYVEKLCREYGVPLEIYHEDVELFAKMRKQSLEEAGRNVRREAFQKTLQAYQGTKIALAHHKNDNAETILMNLSRGSGIRGLTGIRPVSKGMIRPLLCLSRKEIEDFLKQRGIGYCTDETNTSPEYTRNRIRCHILPLLEEEVNEKAVSHMAETAEQIYRICEYMEMQTKEYYRNAVEEKEEGLFIRSEAYDRIPDVFHGELFRESIRRLSGKEQDIHRTHIRNLEELMGKQTGRHIDLPYGITATRCYEGVRMGKQSGEKEEKTWKELQLDVGRELQIGEQKIFAEIWGREAPWEEKVYTKYFDYDIMNRTVTIRTRRPGDYITIDDTGRTQKLKSYFINEKIPREKRDRILLLAEGSHVLWVIGYRRGCAYYVGPDTEKIVKISINKGEEENDRNNQSNDSRRRSRCEDSRIGRTDQ